MLANVWRHLSNCSILITPQLSKSRKKYLYEYHERREVRSCDELLGADADSLRRDIACAKTVWVGGGTMDKKDVVNWSALEINKDARLTLDSGQLEKMC